MGAKSSTKDAIDVSRELREESRIDSAIVRYFGKRTYHGNTSGDWDAVALEIRGSSMPKLARNLLSDGDWFVHKVSARNGAVEVVIWTWT